MNRKQLLVSSGVAVVALAVIGGGATLVASNNDGPGTSATPTASPGAAPSSNGEPGDPTGSASAKPQAPTPPVLQSAALANAGGGVNSYVQLACVVRVEFQDETPSTPENYRATLYSSSGKQLAQTNSANQNLAATSKDQLSTELPCEGLSEGDNYMVKLEEKSEDGKWEAASENKTGTYKVTQAPSAIEDSSVKRKGEWTNFVGKPATITFTGEWEAGTVFTTQVWTSKTKNFTPADYDANVKGTASIVDSRDAAAPVVSWTPPKKFAGRYVWISILGEAPGKAPYRFTFEPELIATK